MPLSFENFCDHCNKIVADAMGQPISAAELTATYKSYLAGCRQFNCEMSITYEEGPTAGEKKLYFSEVRPSHKIPVQPSRKF